MCFNRDLGIIQLRLCDLKALDRLVVSEWEEWVDKAPAYWKADGFLTSRVPISVSSRFGQNQPIGNASTLEAQALRWDEERDYSKIQFVSMAVATDVRCVHYLLLSFDIRPTHASMSVPTLWPIGSPSLLIL